MSICITNKGISRKLFANIEHRSVYHTIYDGNDKCVRMKKRNAKTERTREQKKEEEKEKQNKIIRSNKREHRIFPCLICRMPPTQQREAYTDTHTI